MTKIIGKFKKYLPQFFGILLLVSLSFSLVAPVMAQESPGFFEDPVGAITSGVGNAISSAFNATGNIFENLFVSLIRLIVGAIITIEGWALIVLSKILIGIVQYNDFVNAPAVNVGWSLVRDVSNLFFVLVILAIAIGTILRIESYNFKKFLPKVIIMAVLVNFSLTIAGLILDFAQVIMMTFVVAFVKVGGGGNLMQILQVNEMINATADSQGGWTEEIDVIPVIATAFLAIIMLMIAMMVILVMVVMFVARMIMIWFLLVLSPLPYILSAFPQGMRYAQQWWSEFTKYVIIGPVLAFFLWLSFAVVAQAPASGVSTGIALDGQLSETETAIQSNIQTTTGSESVFTGIGDVNKLMNLIIGIGMLLAGLVVAQQMGTAGAGVASSAFGNIRRGKFIPGQDRAIRWAGRRTDDLFAKANAPLLNRLGRTKLGRQYGLDQLGREGGLRVRSIPAAWRGRSERVEADAMRLGTQALTDVFNRAIPFDPKATDLTRRGRAADVATEQRALADTTTDAEEILHRLGNEDLDKNGHVTTGNENTAIAKLRQLTADHNANEVVLQAADVFGEVFTDDAKRLADVKLTQDQIDAGMTLDQVKQARALDRDANGNIKYTTHNYQEAIRHMFKNYGEEFQAEVMFDLGEIGFANKDQFLYKMGSKDVNSGKFELMTKDKVKKGVNQYDAQQDTAERYAAKLDGRRFIQKSTWQGFMDEVRPGGNTMASNMSDFGLINLARNPKALIAEFHQSSNEIKDRMFENVDVMMATADHARSQGEDQLAKNIESLAGAVVGFKYGGRQGGDNPGGLAEVKALGGDVNAFVRQEAAKRGVYKSGLIGGTEYNKMIADIPANTKFYKGPKATPTPGSGPSAPRMAQDFDRDKHDRTREMVDRYADAGLNFYESADFNPKEFEAENDFRRHHAAMNQTELDKVRGVTTAKTTKEDAEQVGVGINFNDENIQRAYGVKADQDAVYFEGDAREKAIKALVSQYSHDLEGSGMDDKAMADETQKFEEGLRKAKTLRIHNNASLSSRADQARHERAHARTSKMTQVDLNKYWDSLDFDQQDEISADLRKRYGNISDENMKREAVAEMSGVGKGIYEMNDSTRKVLDGMGIKSRGEASIEKMSEAASAARAFGGKIGKGFDKVAQGVGAAASAIQSSADQALKAAEREEELGILQDYRSSRSTLRKAKSDYDKVRPGEESYIREKESEQSRNAKQAKDLFAQAKQAEKAGNVGEARKLTNEGNQQLDRNKYIDGEISRSRERLKKVADEYAKAAADTLRAKEKVDSIRGVPSAAARSAVQQATRETTPEARERVAAKVAPTEYVKASQEEVGRQTEELQRAITEGMDTSHIVQALTNIENVLTSMQGSLGKMPAGQVNQNAKGEITKAIRQLGTIRQTGSLDPNSVPTLLTKINNGIKSLYHSQGKKNPPPTPKDL